MKRTFASVVAAYLVTSSAHAAPMIDVLAAFAPTADKSYKVIIMTHSPARETYCGSGWFTGLILQNEKILGRPGLSNSVGCWSMGTGSKLLNFRYFSLAAERVVEFNIKPEDTRPMRMREDAPLLYD